MLQHILPLWFWIASAALIGLCIGSFLNVVIVRLPARMEWSWRREARAILAHEGIEETAPPDLVFEPSHCPYCKHRLAIRDNLPLIGWLFLGGRCRYCRQPISWQYPAVEALCSLLSAIVVWKFGPGSEAMAGLLFTWLLIALSGIDMRTQLLPDQLVYPLLWLGLLLSIKLSAVDPPHAILAAAVGYLSLWSVYWLFKLCTGKEGMGHGDFKLLAALGAWMGVGALLPVILLSSLVGAITGSLLILLRGHERDRPIPFGPYLAAAGWLWFMAGDAILREYLTYMTRL